MIAIETPILPPNKELTCTTYGFKPIEALFLFEIDQDYTFENLRDFANIALPRGYDIYKTKHGYHLVGVVPNWDYCQKLLDLTKHIFPNSNYIRNCRKCFLRLTAKYDKKTGKEVSPEPELYLCRCLHGHQEKRKGMYSIYDTSD